MSVKPIPDFLFTREEIRNITGKKTSLLALCRHPNAKKESSKWLIDRIMIIFNAILDGEKAPYFEKARADMNVVLKNLPKFENIIIRVVIMEEKYPSMYKDEKIQELLTQ